MYLLKLVIVPTGSLLFRRIPFATTVFPTYPFAPPTALAGFLRRLVMLAHGHELPGDIRGKPKRALNEDAQFYTLPPDYVCLGAYPSAYTTHRTKRHQPWGAAAKFGHFKFSALRYVEDKDNKLNAQIPIWEYLHTERMTGYVVHEQREPLEQLRALENWGGKLGKEGYAFIESVSEVVELQGPQRRKAKPATPIPAEALGSEPANFFTLYAYNWKTQDAPEPTSAEGVPGNGILIQPFLAAWVQEEIELEYYTDGQEYFPKAWIDKLRGGA
ncbi:MAG TPA: hypothetical protein VNK49_00605 [Anaerolineales bacterium]|nr:hypothetical protein [Anaerolineales bacterium]